MDSIETSAADAAREYLRRGMYPVPIPAGEKGPKHRGWPDLRMTLEGIDDHFPTGQPMNIGLLLGAPSGDLVDIDLDCDEAVALAPAFLPLTSMISGRAGRPRSHWWYRATATSEKFAIPGDDGGMVVEIRSTGLQTVVPPSIHPSGEEVVWYDTGEPAALDPKTLAASAASLAAASYTARRWPAPGSRQAFAGALAGLLLRGGVSIELVERIVFAAATCAGDDEVEKRVQFARDTAAELASPEMGGGVTGGPTVDDLAGDPHVSRTIAKWMALAATHDSLLPEPSPAKTPNWASAILQIVAEAGVDLCTNDRGTPFMTFPVDGHRETWPADSTASKGWLIKALWQQRHRAAPATALKEALGVLAARAQFDSGQRQVDVRVAQHGDAIYIDLVNERWEVVEVTPSGWKVLDTSPVLFQRHRAMAALPAPEHGGTLEGLRRFFAISSEATWRLMVVSLVTSFVKDMDHAVVVFHGEQGAAKTTHLRYATALVDPSAVEARSMPRDEPTLIQNAAHGWVLAIDNISYLTADQSDCLCRLSTGGGMVKRQLYTDDEDIVYAIRRVVMMTSIDQVVQRPDLGDRSVFIELTPIEAHARRSRAEMDADFEAARAQNFGALLSVLSAAMARLPEVTLTEVPRMSDFGRWGVAIEQVLGWPEGSFLAAYANSREVAVMTAIEADPVGQAIMEFMSWRTYWKDTASVLLVDLRELMREAHNDPYVAKGWPTQANHLTSRLRRLAPSLRARGIEVQFTQEGKQRTRFVTITRKADGPDDENGGPSSLSTVLAPELGAVAGPGHPEGQ